jgi:hypothetical protein
MATLKRTKRGDATVRGARLKIATQLKLPIKAVRLVLPSKRRAKDSLLLVKLRAKWQD